MEVGVGPDVRTLGCEIQKDLHEDYNVGVRVGGGMDSTARGGLSLDRIS